MRFNFLRKNDLGFTLIELIIAFSIISILAVASIAAFVTYSRNQAVGNEISQLIATLDVAKAKAQAQVKPDDCSTNINPALNETLSEYRVVVDSVNNQYKLVAVCSVSLVDVPFEGKTNAIHKFPSPITVDASYTIKFAVLSGAVNPSPTTITLRGNWAPQVTRSLTIYANGTIK